MKRVQVYVSHNGSITMFPFGYERIIGSMKIEFDSLATLIRYLEHQGGHYEVRSSQKIDDDEDDKAFVIVDKYVRGRGYFTILAEEGYLG